MKKKLANMVISKKKKKYGNSELSELTSNACNPLLPSINLSQSRAIKKPNRLPEAKPGSTLEGLHYYCYLLLKYFEHYYVCLPRVKYKRSSQLNFD